MIQINPEKAKGFKSVFSSSQKTFPDFFKNILSAFFLQIIDLFGANDSNQIYYCRMHIIRDASKDKPFELEMGWLCEETNMKFALVPKPLV